MLVEEMRPLDTRVPDAWAPAAIAAVDTARTPTSSARRLRRPKTVAATRLLLLCARWGPTPSLILFPTLTGLADGLALKELRYAADAGDSPQLLGPPISGYVAEIQR